MTQSPTRTLLIGRIAPGGPVLALTSGWSVECRFTLVASGTTIPVAVPAIAKADHGWWVGTTVNSGVVAQVEGTWQSGASGAVLQAWRVAPVP